MGKVEKRDFSALWRTLCRSHKKCRQHDRWHDIPAHVALLIFVRAAGSAPYAGIKIEVLLINFLLTFASIGL
jgi:hypothetical protein